MRVADPTPLDDRDDRHARAELTFLRLHAEDPGVGLLEHVENLRRGATRIGRARNRFDQQRTRDRAAVGERLLKRGGHVAAGFVGDQRDVLAGLDAEADV